MEAPRCNCLRAANLFCSLVHRALGRCPACVGIQGELQRRLDRKLAPSQIRCPAELTEVAVPVLVGGEHVATLFGGQVFRQRPRRRDFARVRVLLTRWGVPENELGPMAKAYFATPVVPAARFQAMVRLLILFAQNLSESANRILLNHRNGEPACVAQAKDHARAHLKGVITTRDVAQVVGLSEYYFCRRFKQATGMTFTEYVNRTRIERVKDCMADPSVHIGQAAYAAGFQSIPHFDRTFKRYTGMTPHEYRAAQQK